MTDAEFRMMSVVRKIDAATSDGDIDAAADTLEAAIRVRAGWLRELLFALRSIDSGEVFVEMFAASVGAGREAGVIGEKMAGALERLAEQRQQIAYSAPNRIRTCDIQLRRLALYPPELWVQIGHGTYPLA